MTALDSLASSVVTMLSHSRGLAVSAPPPPCITVVNAFTTTATDAFTRRRPGAHVRRRMHTRAPWLTLTHAPRAYTSADTCATTGDRAPAHASSLHTHRDIFKRTPAHPNARALSRTGAQTPKDSQVQTCTRHACTRGHARGITRTRADDTHAHMHPTSAQDKCAGSSTQPLTHAHAIPITQRARAHTLPRARSHTEVEKQGVQVDANFVAGQH